MRRLGFGRTDLVLAAALMLGTSVALAAPDSVREAWFDAARSGRVAELRSLMRVVASPDCRDADGRSALLWAAAREHRDAVAFFLSRGADVDLQDGHGRTALHLAADEGHAGIVELLLDRGATVDERDDDELTPLLAAVYGATLGGSEEAAGRACELLLDAGADIDAASSLGMTALIDAAMHDNRAIVSLLLQRGADPNLQDDTGGTALRRAQQRQLDAVVDMLEPVTNSRDGESRLVTAALDGRCDVVASLLEAGEAPDQRSSSGQTALLVSAEAGLTSCVSRLLATGADPNAGTADSVPLGIASWMGHCEVVRQLLESGADTGVKQGSSGLTPLTLSAIGKGKRDCVRSLVAAGAPVNVRGASGATPLFFAVAGGDTDKVQLLLDAGADPNAAKDDGGTLLMAAAGRGYEDIVRSLLSAGARQDARDSQGRSALDHARFHGRANIVTLLSHP